jgi:dihydromonapterin reductase/dihydrofolate reductase
MNTEPVLITGVGKRIGFYLASHFLKQGESVIGTYRTPHPNLEHLKELGAQLYHCDFANDTQISYFTDSVKMRHSRLRAIIHNASDWIADGSVHVSPADTMRRMMQVHVSAPYQINLALEKLLLASSHACADIIHIGDFVSSRGSKKHIAYAASKAAQDNLTLSFAARLAPSVKVNSIAPALILFNEEDDQEYRDKSQQKSLMQREGGLDEIRLVVDYLLQSQYVTGRILPVDGGRHLK